MQNYRDSLSPSSLSKSIQSSREEQQHASDLIQTILEMCDPYDEILQCNLLLAANCVVDCSAWSVRHDLQHYIANRIFALYGDVLETGRYTALLAKMAATAQYMSEGRFILLKNEGFPDTTSLRLLVEEVLPQMSV